MIIGGVWHASLQVQREGWFGVERTMMLDGCKARRIRFLGSHAVAGHGIPRVVAVDISL